MISSSVQVGGLLHSGKFKLAYRIQDAFTRKRKLCFENLFYYLLNASKKSMPSNIVDMIDDFPVLDFPDISKQVLIFDRGYPSYELFREISRKGLFFVMCLNSRSNITTAAGGSDTYMDYKPREYKTDPVRLRVIRLPLDDGTEETLVTNLFNPLINVEMFRELYFMRWGIEGKYKEFKEQLELEEFTGSRPCSIQQDFYIAMFLTNLVSILKAEADRAITQSHEGKSNQYAYQANRSFLIGQVQKHLVRILCEMEKIADTLQRIVISSAKVLLSIQPDRKYARKRKQNRRKHYNNRKTCR